MSNVHLKTGIRTNEGVKLNKLSEALVSFLSRTTHSKNMLFDYIPFH